MTWANLTGLSVSGDDEPFVMRVLYIVDCRAVHVFPRFILNQDADTVYLDRLFIFFRLIQSQTHSGSASAHSPDKQAQIFSPVLVKYLLDFPLCHICDLYHKSHLTFRIEYSVIVHISG